MSKILSPQEYVARHKQAFRVAFDYLNAHFPPGEGSEWWEQTAKDASDAYMPGDNKLLRELLIGVYTYIEEEYKIRRDNNESENQ